MDEPLILKTCFEKRIIESNSFFVVRSKLKRQKSKSEMDLLIQYWDKKRQGGESKIWDAKFIGHATARDIKIL